MGHPLVAWLAFSLPCCLWAVNSYRTITIHFFDSDYCTRKSANMSSSLPASTAFGLVNITYRSFSCYEEFLTIEEVSQQLCISCTVLRTTPTSQHSNELQNSTVDNAYVCNFLFQGISSPSVLPPIYDSFSDNKFGFSLALILDSWSTHKSASQKIPQTNRCYILLPN